MEYDKYWIYEDYFIFKPEFNEELDDYVELLLNYKKLIFSDYDDYKICIETNNKFEIKYCNNIYLIENMPNSIEELYLGGCFDLELNNLPNSIKIISFHYNSEYNKELNNLPKSLEKLYLPKKYNKEIKKINPNCIIK